MKVKVQSPLVAVLVLVTFATVSTNTFTSGHAQGQRQTFPQTGKTLSSGFLDYWNKHGGLAQFGYPISNEMAEMSEMDGKTYAVQYFERAVFEYHPENSPPNDVLLSLLGVFQYQDKYNGEAPEQRPSHDPAAMYFAQTGKRLGDRFLDYWKSHGGLAQQGYPISDEFEETSPLDGETYIVQYFERAVFEWHLENDPPNDVLLSQLGTSHYQARYEATEASSTNTWLLDHHLVDAEYSPKTDIIVTISTDPSQLNIIHPVEKTIKHVALPALPNCVSVSPDGNYASVGHNAHVSLVDLSRGILVRTYEVSTDAIDIILPGNGHVYVFPRTDQWEHVRNIELDTGKEALEGRFIYAGMLARLHPSGKYIYGADNGLSPADFYKFDISSGKLVELGDSPYHGDFPMGGNLWFSEDGTRLFALAGTVFRSSEVPGQDMIYAGQLAGASGLRWAATSTKTKRVFVLDGGSYNEAQSPGLRVYDSDFYNFLGTVPLPKFSLPSGPYRTARFESQGHYVFVNSEANRVYLLLHAQSSAKLTRDWQVATLDLLKMP